MISEQADWEVHVFFSRTSKQVSYDPDFQREVAWDTPLTEVPIRTYSQPPLEKALKESIEAFKPNTLLVYGWNFRTPACHAQTAWKNSNLVSR